MDSVREILANKGREVLSVRPGDSVYQAMDLMARHDVGALLVIEADQLCGIFSERDYARKIILQGKATFTFGDGRTQVVGKYEGVMLPKNAKYKFEADEAENLVMLRVGAGVRTETGLTKLTPFGTPKDVVAKTSFADGQVKVGNDPKNGESSKKRVYAPGKFFAPE